MSLSGTLNTVTAGLQVTQAALQIVGGNVANAQTPGYVRKTLDQVTTAAGQNLSVRSAAIDRSLDALVQSQLRSATSGGAYADKLSDMYQQLQTLYGAPGSGTGIDTLYNNFTTALQALGTSPDSFSAQSSAVNSAQLLAQQLNSLSNNIQSMRSAAEQGISADVASANSALQDIAKVNQQISTANADDPTTSVLLDQRDSKGLFRQLRSQCQISSGARPVDAPAQNEYVESLRTQDNFDFWECRCRIMRDADVPNSPRTLQVLKRRQLHLPVEEIVDLDKIDPRVLQQLKGMIDLVTARLRSAGPDLGSQKRA